MVIGYIASRILFVYIHIEVIYSVEGYNRSAGSEYFKL